MEMGSNAPRETPAAAATVATNAVVAIWVVFVPAAAVGAVGVPVKAGDARFALAARRPGR